jgi:DNA repair exonuclease SbcCD ATPase subunit
MHKFSNIVTRKFIDTVDLSDLEIETDSGWQPVTAIHKTVPYTVWEIETNSGLSLTCADTHIVFDQNYCEIFVKDLQEGITKILTKNGPELVAKVIKKDQEEHMFDVTVNHPDHRFYTNDILSHNTTIVNSLSYALYGQALTNIKKENLINKINGKGMLVTVEFEKNGNLYRIERGRKPNVMRLFVNNLQQKSAAEDDESQGDSRETQKFIDDLLGMSHNMFKHLVALNTYTEPFLSMRAADQREIIEQLLGITILSEKAEKLKTDVKTTKDLIQEETIKIEAIKRSNDNVQKSINSLLIKSSAWNKKQNQEIENIGKAIFQLESVDIEKELLAHSKLKEWEELDLRIRGLGKQRATLESAVVQAQKTRDRYAQEVETLKTKTCPACKQELHNHKHQEMASIAETHLAESQLYFDKVTLDLKKILEELGTGELPRKPITFYESEAEALEHKNNLSNLEQQLTNKLEEKNPYDEQVEDLKKSAIQEISWNSINKLTKVKDHQEFLLKLLTNKDSFIRKKIIDQNLNYLNKRLGYYIDKLGLPHKVIFLNDLTVEITQLGQELDFDNLSRGERNRLILSLSFAFRDVWENLYQNINLLFIDELIDAGMDSAGVEAGLAILKKMGRERNKNIYLISHKDELVSRVNNVLRVIKENGFTSYSNSTDYIEAE